MEGLNYLLITIAKLLPYILGFGLIFSIFILFFVIYVHRSIDKTINEHNDEFRKIKKKYRRL